MLAVSSGSVARPILVVDDDPTIARLGRTDLEAERDTTTSWFSLPRA
jgi:CheY-like chemotaxis protein